MQWSLILPLVTVGTLVWLENKTNNTSTKIKSKSIASTLGKEELVHLLNNKLPSWVIKTQIYKFKNKYGDFR